MNPPGNPLMPFIARQGCVILDGGLATALEARGHDLNDPLWSARLLLDDPDAIRQVHLDYLLAGADVITTASYQASAAGFARRGLDPAAAELLLRRSVQLAGEARDQFWHTPAHRTGRLRPLIAASIGPYGAVLADGSEYRGNYDLPAEDLAKFHRARWDLLARTEADLLACETIPSALEARLLLEQLAATDGRWAWLSFSCRNDALLCDGTPLARVLADLPPVDGLAGLGINCTAPDCLVPLLERMSRATDVPLLAYPNLGERYLAASKTWADGPTATQWLAGVPLWRRSGAVGVGGCCRVGPELIAAVRQALLPRG